MNRRVIVVVAACTATVAALGIGWMMGFDWAIGSRFDRSVISMGRDSTIGEDDE